MEEKFNFGGTAYLRNISLVGRIFVTDNSCIIVELCLCPRQFNETQRQIDFFIRGRQPSHNNPQMGVPIRLPSPALT